MKRYTYYILFVLLFIVSSCTNEDDYLPGEHSISLSIAVANYDDDQSGESRSSSTDHNHSISNLTIAVYDGNGSLMKNLHTSISPDNKNISIEGLPDGKFKLLFLATAEVLSEDAPIITPPDKWTENWIPDYGENTPCPNEYLYAQSELTVIDAKCVAPAQILLKRVVGKVIFDINTEDVQFPLGSITRIAVSFDKNSVYKNHATNNSYSNTNTITDYELSSSHYFYSLPTVKQEAYQGIVTLYSTRPDGSKAQRSYNFKASIQANKRSIVRVNHSVENERYGLLRAFDIDRSSSNTRLFFQDGQSYKSLQQHSFYPSQPIGVTIDEATKKVLIKCYVAKELKNVTVLAKRPNSNEYFELVWLESIKPFEERELTLPENRIYKTESGKVIFVDNLSEKMRFKYQSDDNDSSQFLQRVNTITWPIEIRFSRPSSYTPVDTINNTKELLHLRPIHAREAVVLYTNMGYAISNDWRAKMLEKEAEAPFLDGPGKTISLEGEVFPRIWNPEINKSYVNTFLISVQHPDYTLWGVATVGSGLQFAIRQQCYTEQYKGGFVITTPYHEYGHVLGYGHNGNMTYGAWQEISESTHSNLYRAGRMPYSSNTLQSLNNPNLYKIVNGVVK